MAEKLKTVEGDAVLEEKKSKKKKKKKESRGVCPRVDETGADMAIRTRQ
jgi:hypothetical protein